MSVKIRMKRMGSKKRPFYRLVAADSRYPRDGRFLEILGYYNPMVEPAEIRIEEDKIYRWLDSGAQPTPNARNILRSVGILERWRLLRSGVSIAELDARVEELRGKQPRAKAAPRVKLSKKAAAAIAAAQKEESPPGGQGEAAAAEGATETAPQAGPENDRA